MLLNVPECLIYGNCFLSLLKVFKRMNFTKYETYAILHRFHILYISCYCYRQIGKNRDIASSLFLNTVPASENGI